MAHEALRITKETEGIGELSNHYICLTSIEHEGDIIIDLDAELVVDGLLHSRAGSIISKSSIRANDISAYQNITCGGDITTHNLPSRKSISASWGSIAAKGDIESGTISAGRDITSSLGHIVAEYSILARGSGSITASAEITADQGRISAGGNIKSGWNIISNAEDIYAEGSISASDSIVAKTNIRASGSIDAGHTVRAYHRNITAGGDITAGTNVIADRGNITAGGNINSGETIDGICVTANDISTFENIYCSALAGNLTSGTRIKKDTDAQAESDKMMREIFGEILN